MKCKLLLLGKTDEAYLEEGINKYIARLKHYCSFELIVIPALKNTKGLTNGQQKNREAQLILKSIQPTDHVILLDENGKELSSKTFASFIEKLQLHQAGTICFIVGGPYGFDDALYKLAKERISLSKMTFSHQMVRLFFLEQLYRAFTIIRNEPYHHG